MAALGHELLCPAQAPDETRNGATDSAIPSRHAKHVQVGRQTPCGFRFHVRWQRDNFNGRFQHATARTQRSKHDCHPVQPVGHRRRFRSPVRAADRAARARLARVLGNRPMRHHRRRGARACARGHHPVGRPGQRVRRGRAVHRPGHLRAGHPRAGLLLRPADYGRHAGRHRGPHREGRVRGRAFDAARRGSVFAVRRDARRADGVDEPPRRRVRGSRRVRGNGLDRRVPRGLDGMRRAPSVRDAVPPRGAPHAARRPAAEELPVRHLRP